MAGIDRWKISPETRATFTAILDEAPHLGIDRDQVAAAGLPGLRALIALKGVAEAGTRRAKSRALADAQDAVASLAHRKQSRLVNQVQARLLALQGRGSDTEVAHVARGELVVPQAMQGTIVLQVLREAAAAQGIPLEMLRVGSGNNSINPATKAPEFGVMNWLEEVAGVRQQDPNYQREQEQGRNVGGIARIAPILEKSANVRERYVDEVSALDPYGNDARTALKPVFREMTPAETRAAIADKPTGPREGSVGRANVTNPQVNRIAMTGGAIGRGLGVLGVGLAAKDIATSDNRLRAALANAGAAAGGYIGGEGGAALGTLGGLAAPITVPVAAVAGAMGGGSLGYQLGEDLYDIGESLYDHFHKNPAGS